jgi:DNA adenine methylase
MFESITNVENMDFQEVIEKYDSDGTYFYTDPPYYIVGEGSYYSKHEFSRNDHERLANTLKKIKGKFSLSYYDFDLLHQWFPEDEYSWEEKQFAKAAAATKGKAQNMGTEILIMNYSVKKTED